MPERATPGPWHDDAEQRWRGRPGLARTVRVGVYLGPLAISLAVTSAVSRQVRAPTDAGPRILWWIAMLLLASAVVWVSDRALRRLLPTAALLEMSVLFPGRAPSRFSVARQTGSTRQLEALVQRPHTADDEPVVAAARILALVSALRAHDRATRGHSERVRVLTDIIGEEMGLAQADRDRLRWAALLHDIGKLRVPAEILNMHRAPSAEEWEQLKAHPEAGQELARPLLSWLGSWGSVIVQHHERWDGHGYPQGLSGEQICVGARIVSVADTFEVMTAGRPYQRPMPRADALRAVAKLGGTQLDPSAVRALLSISAPGLRGAVGFWGWVSQLPVLSTAPSLAGAVVTTAAAGAGALALGGTLGLAALPLGPAYDGHANPRGIVASAAAATGAATTGTADGASGPSTGTPNGTGSRTETSRPTQRGAGSPAGGDVASTFPAADPTSTLTGGAGVQAANRGAPGVATGPPAVSVAGPSSVPLPLPVPAPAPRPLISAPPLPQIGPSLPVLSPPVPALSPLVPARSPPVPVPSLPHTLPTPSLLPTPRVSLPVVGASIPASPTSVRLPVVGF